MWKPPLLLSKINTQNNCSIFFYKVFLIYLVLWLEIFRGLKVKMVDLSEQLYSYSYNQYYVWLIPHHYFVTVPTAVTVNFESSGVGSCTHISCWHVGYGLKDIHFRRTCKLRRRFMININWHYINKGLILCIGINL